RLHETSRFSTPVTQTDATTVPVLGSERQCDAATAAEPRLEEASLVAIGSRTSNARFPAETRWSCRCRFFYASNVLWISHPEGASKRCRKHRRREPRISTRPSRKSGGL